MTDGSSNHKRAQKTDGIICFQNVSAPWVFKVNNDLWLKLTGHVSRLSRSVLKNSLIWLQNNQKRDPILVVSIKMFRLPRLKSYTYGTYMNVQQKSPCKSVRRVSSKFISRFSLNRVLNFRESINFNLFHSNYFWSYQKVLPDHV